MQQHSHTEITSRPALILQQKITGYVFGGSAPFGPAQLIVVPKLLTGKGQRGKRIGIEGVQSKGKGEGKGKEKEAKPHCKILHAAK